MFNLLFGNKSNTISASDAKNRLAQGNKVVLLDVRTPQEYAEIRIPSSLLIPVDKLSANVAKVIPNKDAEIIVYCRSGMRAKTALAQLKSMGYANVKNLGGIIDWPYETSSK